MIHTITTLEDWEHPDGLHQLAFACLSCGELLVVLGMASHFIQGMEELFWKIWIVPTSLLK